MLVPLRHLRYVFLLAGLLFFSAVHTYAQTSSAGSISGRVLFPNGNFVNQNVRISLETIRGIRSSVFTDNQGQFVFRGLTPGSYQLVADADATQFEVTTARVEVFPGAPSLLTIVLKEKRPSGESRKGGNTISAIELAASIPGKARKEFERASSASKDGKKDEAIAHLRKAIELYP
ncbi:MAG: carboxypeptidase regulatory-like domain-containing protein, partial [Acidobacteriota bacterium]|nr:carboxypeptidase regulatory-like domain-containing protein [Acidobacteriota bacterium]